jgi:predicted transcriptional regulator of viral defense system
MYNDKTESQGTRLMRQLQAQGKTIFSRDEAELIGISESIPTTYLNIILSNLVKAGRIIRLRRGLYAGFGLFAGQIHVHPFAIATRLVEPSFISHWSALQHHGLTEQIPQIITASSGSKVFTPSMRSVEKKSEKHAWIIQGVRYEYFQVKPNKFFGLEEIWVDQDSRVPMTDQERTVIDLFACSSLFGGIGEVLGIVEQALPRLNLKKLVEYALMYGEKSLCKRLGWVLEQLQTDAILLEPLLKIQNKSYCYLDPKLPKEGKPNRRWMIVENLKS